MFSQGNVIFFVVSVLGGLVFCLFMRWNNKRVSSELLKKSRNELSTTKQEWTIPVILGVVVTANIEIQKFLGYENLGMVIPLCVLGVLLIRGRVKKDIHFAKLQFPSEYIRTNHKIVSVASAFFIALGLLQFIIFLRSEFF